MSEQEPVDVRTHDTSRTATAVRVLRNVARRPTQVLTELNRGYHWRLHTRPYNPDGVNVVAADWDTLVILDACRYDTFADHADLPGDLTARTSRGTDTFEFLRGNFHGRRLLDTVYVTANPRFFRRREDLDTEFHDVVNVWRAGWDESEGTVLPETTAGYALEGAAEYPHKRLIVHFMQPHYPFVGSDIENDKMIDEYKLSVWDQVEAGDVDAELAIRDYEANLRQTVPAVERLLAELEGRTVVTADHGNMLGETAGPLPVEEWGHPCGIHVEPLTRVPWLVNESGERREIRAEETVESSTADVEDDVVSDRLRQLGYRA